VRQSSTARRRGPRLAAAGTLAVVAPAALLLAAGPSSAAAPAPGDLLVYRVGTGTGALVNTGNAVFLDEYTTTGTLVQSIPLPTAASSSNKPCIASGTASSEGQLSTSTDGAYVVATCYGTAPGGTASLSGTSATAVPRVVARLDATGAVDTSTALTDFASGNNPRTAATPDGTALYVGGAAGGARYTTVGSTTSTQLETTQANVRAVSVAGGQLSLSTGSAPAGVYSVGSGLPTTAGQTTTALTASASPYSFAALHTGPSGTAIDTLYVADDNAGAILKYNLVGGTWTAEGSITATAVRGIVARTTATGVSLYGTTGGTTATGGGGTIYAAADPTGFGAATTGTAASIATATANEAFRGIAFAPQAPVVTPPTQPGTSLPEAPYALLIPLVGAGVLGAVVLRRKDRVRG